MSKASTDEKQTSENTAGTEKSTCIRPMLLLVIEHCNATMNIGGLFVKPTAIMLSSNARQDNQLWVWMFQKVKDVGKWCEYDQTSSAFRIQLLLSSRNAWAATNASNLSPIRCLKLRPLKLVCADEIEMEVTPRCVQNADVCPNHAYEINAFSIY